MTLEGRLSTVPDAQTGREKQCDVKMEKRETQRVKQGQ